MQYVQFFWAIAKTKGSQLEKESTFGMCFWFCFNKHEQWYNIVQFFWTIVETKGSQLEKENHGQLLGGEIPLEPLVGLPIIEFNPLEQVPFS